MNAHTTIEAAQLPATLENIDDLVKGRDTAISLWMERYDQFHALGDLCDSASIAGAISIRADSGGRYDHDKVSPAFVAAPDAEQEHWIDGEHRKRERLTGRQWFERVITEAIDRRCWSIMLKRLNFDRFLDRQAREEFEASLKGTPPAFDAESCMATFGHYWANRGDIWLRGLANTFKALDRRFRSHDAFAIGNRVVVEYAFSEYGSWQAYNRRDTIRDVERVFREMDGQPPCSEADSITYALQRLNSHRRTAGTVEGEYFRARTFKNGNCHLWFTRKDLLAKVNKHLLDYFKPLEGDSEDGGPTYDAGPLYHQTPAKNFGEFFTSPEVAALVIEAARIDDGMTVLEPSAGQGALALAARAKGAHVECIEIQELWAEALRRARFPVTHGDFLKIDPARHGTQYDRMVVSQFEFRFSGAG